ncbi:MAG TPA: hypothetical protein VKD47_07955 [Miltoncostaeaceae bacterium]|nr:hypothetical protein [Miltoncostaeaceae bacterium]
MLNGRLYRNAWLVAGIALVVAFLTLAPIQEPPPSDIVTVFDAASAASLTGELEAVADTRASGSPGAVAAAAWVQRRFRELAGGDRRTGVQHMAVRADGQDVPLTNVFFAVPATADTRSRRVILVVAPRDTPPGVASGASATGVLVELARFATTVRYHHPLLFLSTDGSVLGNAGARWFLHSASRPAIAGAIVLDAPADATGTRVHLWEDGGARQALGMRVPAEREVRLAGGQPSPVPGLGRQLLRLAAPETRGDQAPFIAAGVPAITLANRAEGPLEPASRPTPERLDLVGNAAQGLLGSVDAVERPPAPDTGLAFAGKTLRPAVARLALLLLTLPLLVMALDAGTRLRRARVRLAPGMAGVAWRFAAPMAALFVAHLLSMYGVIPAPVLGRPPLPGDVGFDSLAGLSVVLVALVSVGVWALTRRRALAASSSAAAEATAALIWISLLALIAWWWTPFALVFILPAGHAALGATVVRRKWQVWLLAAIAVVAPLALVGIVSGAIDRNPFTAVWYLIETSASGARGWVGPTLATLVGVAVWCLAAPAVRRGGKTLPAPRRRRAARAPVV